MNVIGAFFQLITLIAVVAAAGGISRLALRRLEFSVASTPFFLSCDWALAGMALAGGTSLDSVERRCWAIQSILDNASQVPILVLMFYAGLYAEGWREEFRITVLALWLGEVGVALAIGAWIATNWRLSLDQSLPVAAVAVISSLSILPRSPEEVGKNSIPVNALSWSLRQWAAVPVAGFLLIFAIFRANEISLVSGYEGMVRPLLIAKTAVFFLIVWLLSARYVKRLSEYAGAPLSRRALCGFILMSALIYAYGIQFLRDFVGFAWAYLCGVLFARTHFRESIKPGRQGIGYIVCLPILFLWAGLRTDLRGLDTRLGMVLAAAWAIKVLGGSLAGKLGRLSWRDSVLVGFWTLPQAETGILLARFGLTKGVIGMSAFSVVILGVVATTLLVPLLERVLPSLLEMPLVARREDCQEV